MKIEKETVGGIRATSTSAVVIRADGTRVDLGRVAYWHTNSIRRMAWQIFERPLVERRIRKHKRSHSV